MSFQNEETIGRINPGDLYSYSYMNVYNMQEVTIFGICIEVRGTRWARDTSFVLTLLAGGEIKETMISSKDEVMIYKSQSCSFTN
jgi:hypothetical protein